MKQLTKLITSPVALLLCTVLTAASILCSCKKEEGFADANFTYSIVETRGSKIFTWEPGTDGLLHCPEQTLTGVTITSHNYVDVEVTSDDQNFSGVTFISSDESVLKITNIETKKCHIEYVGPGNASILMTAGAHQKTVAFEVKESVPLEGVQITVGGREYLIPQGSSAAPNFICISPDGKLPEDGGEELVITGIQPENASLRFVNDFKGAGLIGNVSYDAVNKNHYGAGAPSFCRNGHESLLDISDIIGRTLFFSHEEIARGYLSFTFGDKGSPEYYAELSYLTEPSWEDDGLSFGTDVGRYMNYEFPEYERIFKEYILNMYQEPIAFTILENDGDWIECKVIETGLRVVLLIHVKESFQDASRTAKIKVYAPGRPGEGCLVEIKQTGLSEGNLRGALKDLYNACNGQNWVHNNNWGSEKALTQWYGLTPKRYYSLSEFGGTGSVYFGTDNLWSIKLTSNNMNKGAVPESFWKACRYFESIEITRTYLAESVVPDCVWHENLKKLDLNYSFMAVPLGPAIANAKTLQYIDLDHCKINGPIPEEMTTLASLETLRLMETGLTGSLPANLGNLKNLKMLYVCNNLDLGGVLPESFYELYNIQLIAFDYTKIGGTLSEKISELKQLFGFNINGCKFEGKIPEEFGNFKHITCDFNGNYFEAIPQYMRFRPTFNMDWHYDGFPAGIPYFYCKKEEGHPDGYIIRRPDFWEMKDICVDGVPIKKAAYSINYDLGYKYPQPVWAFIRFGVYEWTYADYGAFKYPQYPIADDLQYPADEYYYDGKDWRHPKYEYPAREYVKVDNQWIHDPSCPWDKEYPRKHED